MPWSDHSDDEGAKVKGDKPTAAKPTPPKAGARAGGKPGPWGAPPAPGPVAGPEPGPDRARKTGGDAPRKPPVGGPRKPTNTPTPDDLTIMLRRLRQRVTAEYATLRASGAPPRLVAAAVGVVLALWMLSGVYRVQTGQVGVVTTFGAYSRTDDAGPSYHLPAPIERVTLISTSALQVMDIGAAGADDPRSVMLTGDGNIASVNFTVRYRIADARKYLFDVKEPTDAIRAVAESAIRQAVGAAPYAQLLGGDHTPIQTQTRALMQAALERYGAGVKVVDVQIIAAGPPKAVTAESQAVAAARQSAQTAVADANTYAAKLMSDAHGASTKLRIDAETQNTRLAGEAAAETSRFSQLDQEYRLAPAMTKQRLYTDAMQRILSRANKVVVDARGAATPMIVPPEAFRAHRPTVEATGPGAGQ